MSFQLKYCVFATPQLLTSLQSQIKELVPPRLLSARQTPSFLSRRRTTGQVNKIQGRHTATAHKQKKGSKMFQYGYCFKCPR